MDGMTSPEIGSFTGTVIFLGDGTDAGLVQITADGAWTITPKACNG